MTSSFTDMAFILLALVPFYAIGAYPTGYFIARRHGIDVLNYGSGNPGAANIARVAGARAGLLTLLGDVSKGLCAVLIARLLWSNPALAAFSGLATVAGHCFSIPGKLRGGKGVATSLGVLMGLHFFTALCAIAVFAIVLGASRIVSIASVSAAFTAPLSALLMGVADSTLSCLMLISVIVIYRHKSNLLRLTLGTEKKFSFGGE